MAPVGGGGIMIGRSFSSLGLSFVGVVGEV